MNRTCLLSRAYDGPMIFNGQEIFYSPLVNEILRETKNGFFYGSGQDAQTEFLGVCEAFLVMSLCSAGRLQELQELRRTTQEMRNRTVLDFALEHAAEIERVKPQFVERVHAVLASTVEGTAPGKSH